MAKLKVNQKIRDQQARYQAERASWRCLFEMCDHGHKADPLPPGVEAVLAGAFDSPKVVLVRYTKRSIGGWYVVRADNGRVLGWTLKNTAGEFKESWTCHVNAGAFRGVDVDDEGDVMDYVPERLFNGKNQLHSKAIDFSKDRGGAAATIVSHLAHNGATALGFGEHPGVRMYRTRPEQHFALGEGKDEHCSCGGSLPCPRRAELEEGR